MKKVKTHSFLEEWRKRRGLPAAELAQRVGVSRQTIYAIEDGSYVPNTTIALRLARILEIRVEELFSLEETREELDKPLRAELLKPEMAASAQSGELVRLCRVQDQLIAVPLPVLPAYLPSADAVVEKCTGSGVAVRSFLDAAGYNKRLLLAGCDPALSLLTDVMALSGMEIISVPCPSRRALQWLKQGRIHAAGSHLLDRATGEYNVPIVQQTFPKKGAVCVVTFAVWEQGLVVQPENPKSIQSIADVGRPDVTIINREEGSGSRDLLDTGLHAAGISQAKIVGYERVAHGHLPAAYAVLAGQADCCIANRAAAQRFGLHFIPLAKERFDLTFSRESLHLPVTKALLDTLNQAALQRKLQQMAGYETQSTGCVQLA